MVQNRISVEPFRRDGFQAALHNASNPRPASSVASQVKYLARYCKWLGAKTVVSEDHYIDRHFLDEYALYYSRNLEPPPSHVRRFHLFSTAFADSDLSSYIERAARLDGGGFYSFMKELSTGYLGFISIRPLSAVPVGRTVLRQLDDGQKRDIWTTGSHDVHIANLRLTVDGLAFLQQDVAVGACATAAVWSALSRVTRREGIRAPTPAAVSQAAVRHLLGTGRSMPAGGGMTSQQLWEAVRASGFEPEHVRGDGRPEHFILALHTYLLSGIPVVLGLEGKDGQHAVTAVGFQTVVEPNPLLQTALPVRSARMRKLYVHDDRIGPYARAFLRPIPTVEGEFSESLVLEIEPSRDDQNEEQTTAPEPPPDAVEKWVIESAIAPVYPKLRLSVPYLITLADLHADVVEQFVGSESPRLSVEFYYERSGSYLLKASQRMAPGNAAILRQLALPRWCGVVRWYIADGQLAEFVYDSTDILRDEYGFGAELLRAIICLDQRYRQAVEEIAKFFGVPWG